MKNGWCVVCGVQVFVENGKVVRGIMGKGMFDVVTCYPYVIDRKYGGWDNASGDLTVDALRARMKRGTAVLM